ncbi:bucky ball isoform X2 [Leuresthes tenuis]|uniref:bucky ball isoform X2 n=1 Tax=Leuresthes tenuis TaxID=355514 RepID=UPI003B50E5C8
MKMDDASKQPHSLGSGAQRSHHPRPFFYVQPPSQPYYLYQHLQLNNPYSQYGMPGGFNFGRPCMPFPYMPYPGFVLPHAPIYPMDYRRMFEPRFHAPAWGDMPRQQHYPQPHGRREMACSEAQTDPSDAITKLIECLDKIRATELQVANRELDSGVASQSSSVFSPGKATTKEEQGHNLTSAPQNSCLEFPAVTYSESTAVMYDSESRQMNLDPLIPQGCWSGGLEEDLPLDTSSVHEECPELERSASDEHFVPLKKEVVTDIQSNISVTDSSAPRCDAEDSSQSLSFPSSQLALKEVKSSDKVSKGEHLSCDEAKPDQSCHILKLPFDDVMTPGAAGASHLSSPAAPYYYNYNYMQTQERMSVLSPSLDELSSRDEMFSTDLDDVDLFPERVYSGRRLAEVIGGSPPANVDSKRFMCACCGKSLAKGMSRSKVHSSKRYQDEAGDSEEDSRYGRGCEQPVRVAVRKHSALRKAHPLPQRHVTKTWCKRGLSKELSDPVEQEQDRDVCKQEATEGETGELDNNELQCRTCQDTLCRGDLTAEDQGRWGDGDVMPRRRQAAALQRQEMSTQWKLMYHKPREENHDDDEPPAVHWERGSMVRTEPRC